MTPAPGVSSAIPSPFALTNGVAIRIPFQVKMAAIAGMAVLLASVIVMAPLYLEGPKALAQMQGWTLIIALAPFFAFALVLAVALAYWTTSHLVRGITAVTELADAMSRGNLRHELQ